jgi:hypothetical protein
VKYFITMVIVAFVILLAGCSGYFSGENNTAGSGKADTLALSGGGYLSSLQYDDRSPFLYRDPDSGKAWLFFSSKRGGNNINEIYYAALNSDGKFSQPVKMDSNINNGIVNSDSPVVFQALDHAGATNIYLSILRGGSIETWYLDSNFNTTNTASEDFFTPDVGGGPTAIGLYQDDPAGSLFSDSLIVFYGTNFIETYIKQNEGSFYWSYVNLIDLNRNVYSGCGSAIYFFGISKSKVKSGWPSDTNTYDRGYIFSVISNKPQLAWTEDFSGSFSLGLAVFPDYASAYQDTDPMVDPKTLQVYFASDRNGSGNFDLYRYNVKTFDQAMKNSPPPAPILSVYENYDGYSNYILVQWPEIRTASGYNLYSSTNGKDFSLIFTTNNNYVFEYYDYEFQVNITNYYKMEAYNDEGDSDFSAIAYLFGSQY